MPHCTNDISRHFTGTEPSPKGFGVCAHAEKAGSEMRGADNRMWRVVTDKSGRKVWKHAIPASLDKMSNIYTDDNAGRFLVYFEDPMEKPGRVEVYAAGKNYYDEDVDVGSDMELRQYFTRHVASWSSGAKVILGKVQLKKKFRWPWQSEESVDSVPKYHDGITLLIQQPPEADGVASPGTGKYMYVHVGSEVYAFNTPGNNPIIEYFSYNGGTTVPRPVAFTSTHAIFMPDKRVVALKHIPESFRTTEYDRGHLYSWFYDQKNTENHKNLRTKTLADL